MRRGRNRGVDVHLAPAIRAGVRKRCVRGVGEGKTQHPRVFPAVDLAESFLYPSNQVDRLHRPVKGTETDVKQEIYIYLNIPFIKF